MDFADVAYQAFLTQLRRLSFFQVAKILKRREDLVALTDKDGVRITPEDPSFGAYFNSLKTEQEQREARLEYRYFCGFAGDIFFRNSARSDRQVYFLPIIKDPEYLHGPPALGDYLMGETEQSPDTVGGMRFIWWTRLHKQDYRFVQIMLGQPRHLTEKFERKLTVEYRGCRDRRLFLLAMALHFRDIAFFMDLARRGEIVRGNKYTDSVGEWLHRHVAPLLPDFWEQFAAEVGKSG